MFRMQSDDSTVVRTNQDGTAAIEFAIIVPVLIALFLGGVSAFDGNRAAAMLTRASTVLVDLATRQTVIDDTRRDVLFTTAAAIAGPYARNDDFLIVMSSITNPADDDDPDLLVLDWSEASRTGKALQADDLADLSLPPIPDGDSMIVVTVSATHEPIVGWSVVRPWSMTRTSIRRPRFSSSIPYAAI